MIKKVIPMSKPFKMLCQKGVKFFVLRNVVVNLIKLSKNRPSVTKKIQSFNPG